MVGSIESRHDATIAAISQALLLTGFAIVGLWIGERVMARLIDGHDPIWGLVGTLTYSAGLVVAEVISGVILMRATRRGL